MILFFVMVWAWFCLAFFTAKPARGFFFAPFMLALLAVQLVFVFIRGGVNEVLDVFEV